MINIIASRFPNFEMRMNSGLAMPSQVNDLDGILESNQTLLVVHNDKIKRKIRSNLCKGSGKLLAPTFTFRSLFNHLSGFTCKAQSVISKLEQAFRMRKAIIETGVGSSAVSTELIKRCCKARYSWGTEQDCPPNSTFVGKIIESYVKKLSEDGVWDEISIIDQVINELSDSNPNVLKNHLSNTFKNLFIDGVSSVSKVEAQLIEKLANILEVKLWVYEPDCFKGQLLKAIENQFSSGIKSSVFVDATTSTKSSNLSLIEVATSKNTPTTVAGLIKKQLVGNKGLNPSDITVVVSTQEYATLLEEELDRFGISNSQQARTHELGDSSIIRLFKWFLGLNVDDLDAKELFGILENSRVDKMLTHGFRLHYLENDSLPQLKPKKHKEWLEFWKNIVIPEQLLRKKEKSSAAEIAKLEKELLELVDSIAKIFEMFSEVFKIVKGSNLGATLAQNLGKILNELAFDKWLSPALALHDTISLVFDKEWESEQLAWQNLKDLVEDISLAPDIIFPVLDDGTPDLKIAFNLIVDMVGYKTRAIDKTGIQIVSPRNFMGNITPLVYWLGMNHGEFPKDLSGQVALHFVPLAEAERLGHESSAVFEQHVVQPSSQFIVVRAQKKRDEIQLPNTIWGKLAKNLPSGSNVLSENIDGNFCETKGIYVSAKSIFTGKTDKLLDDFVEREQNIVKRLPFQIGNEYHGLLSQLYKPEATFAVTKLEKHFECPFIYFGKTTLGIKEETENFQHMKFGNMIHSVLQDNFNDWKSNPGSRSLYDPVKLVEILNSYKESYQNILEPYFMHKANLVVAAFSNDPNFLKLQNEGYVQTNSEQDFDCELGFDDAGKVVIVKGQRDSIHEKIKEGVRQIMIEDYKTGRYKQELPKRAFQSMMIQLPLYAHAYVHALLNEANKNKSPCEQIDVNFRYVYLGAIDKFENKINIKLIDQNQSIKLVNGAEPPAFSLMGDNLAKKVIEEVGAIRKGLISLTPYHPNYTSPVEVKVSASPCNSYCSMRKACRTSEGVLKPFG